MMGTRSRLTAPEWDAFSRYSRHLLRWAPGELRKIKRKFWRRVRVRQRAEMRAEMKGVGA
ncbi:hypothetical protein [Bosea sp. AS-1]|uniref:hypothetical protein n=1 Tax=Bosea sp. AS-1 TaxID=2015316 RepID=UPI000B777931|nr:hypothetical protein [Bosea sp. AS-1]